MTNEAAMPRGYEGPSNNSMPDWKRECVRHAPEILPSLGWSELRDFSDSKWNTWKKRIADDTVAYLAFPQSGSNRATVRVSVHNLTNTDIGYANLDSDLWNLIKANNNRTMALLYHNLINGG